MNQAFSLPAMSSRRRLAYAVAIGVVAGVAAWNSY